MKARAMRELSPEELKLRVEEAKKELFALRVRTTTKELTDPNKIGNMKREVARLHTVLAEKTRGNN
ncbi:50S ribosomal protein L29 [Candidatus Poribacteria bacterium]|nr:50S ribosomal protein L29 [Candidatus Poribacteria bacterium]